MSNNFYPLKVADVRQETADSISLKFDVPGDLDKVFAFKAGQHLTLRKEIGGQEINRNYSLCVAPHEGELRIAIKRLEGGVFSSWAHGELRRGHVFDIMPAIGHFVYDFQAASQGRYVGIAAGSGITPVLSLLKDGLQKSSDSHFTLLYGNRTSSSIMFLEEIADLKDRYVDRFEIYHFLSNEFDEIELFNGRLNAAKYNEIFPTLIAPAKIDAFFICGPFGMLEAAEAALLAHQVDPGKILAERFTAGRPDEARATVIADLTNKAAGIKFMATLDGRRRSIDFDPAKKNLLDNAREAGLPAPFACKAGVCATCRAKLISGKVEMATNYGLSKAEIDQGYILTCQSVPLSDDVVIDYDA